MKRETVGVVVARFQVPELSPGHKALLGHAKNANRRLAVVLGTTQFPDERNPLTFEMRRDMLIGIADIVLQLPDRPGDNDGWSRSLDLLLRLVYPNSDITLYGGRKSFLGSYTGTHKTELFKEVWEPPGTALREDVAGNFPINSYDFRCGVIYAVTNYVAKPTPADGQLQSDSLAPVSAWDDYSVKLPGKSGREDQ